MRILTAKFALFLHVFIFAGLFVAKSQESSGIWYGVFAGLQLNQHSSSFRALPGVPSCCPVYENGSGTGVAIGGKVDIPLANSLWFSIRPNFSTYNSTLRAQEFRPVRLLSGEIATGEIEHSIKTNISAISADLLLQYRALSRLHLSFGLRSGIVAAADYTQAEQLITAGGTFENGKKIQNEFSGNISSVSPLNLGMSVGMHYAVPLNYAQSFVMTPEVLFSYGLTPILEGYSWNNHFIRMGVGIQYSPIREQIMNEPVTPHIPEKPTIAVQQPQTEILQKIPPALSVQLLGNNSLPNSSNAIEIEEIYSKQIIPLLPIVFFEENSSAIPARYFELSSEAKTKEFDEKELITAGAIGGYRHLLNIIGKRMKVQNKTAIRLVGTNADFGSERGNIKLSENRAAAIKKYLTGIWGIAPDRIKIEYRNLPAKYSNIESLEGQEENRRVELFSDAPELFAPIVQYDTVRTTNTSAVLVSLTGDLSEDISSYQLSASNAKFSLPILSGGSTPVFREFRWDITDPSILDAIKNHDAFQLVADLKSTTGDGERIASSNIPIVYKKLLLSNAVEQSKKIQQFNVIMFDVDKSELNSENKKFLQQFIEPELKSASKIQITGYTDRTGDDNYNLNLSLARARSAAKELGAPWATVKGAGETRPLFDNNLPEGRFYNRTVEIIIED